MPIINMASSETEARERGGVNVRQCDGHPNIWLYDSHVGLCISDREANGYDDSDFWMTVWNPERQVPEEICFASTRGWSYPCYGSAPDATPEIQAAYDAYMQAKRDAFAATKVVCEAATPTRGKRVEVISGRKLPIGTTGTVFWYGEQREFGPMYRNGYKRHGKDMRAMAERFAPPADGLREGRRVGIVLDSDGSKVFTAATNVKVID